MLRIAAAGGSLIFVRNALRNYPVIKILNKNNYIPKSGDFYIGRSSVLGNPYSHLPNSRAEFVVSNRAEAILKYREWLAGQSSPEIEKILYDIGTANLKGEARLVCHCVPLPCHGQVVREEVWKLTGFRVGVIGSRTVKDKDLIFKTLDSAFEKFPHFTKIVSGGAKGADSLGEAWGIERGIECQLFHPDWLNHGKAAGFIRNKLIVQNCDVIFAFQKDNSRGTQHSIDYAKEIGVPVKLLKL